VKTEFAGVSAAFAFAFYCPVFSNFTTDAAWAYGVTGILGSFIAR
jgi:hypothetical protein